MKKNAFSLVELSIVLVILGLLTGGILAGQNLIRAAELRGVTTQMQQLQTAVFTFRDKYFALPGDFAKATDFWGSVTDSGDTCPGTAGADAGTGTETCNGDGDGILENRASNTASDEIFRLWDHMASAGLIEGTYTGIKGAGAEFDALIGLNVPSGKMSNTCFSAHSGFTADASSTHFAKTYTNRLFFGATAAGQACTQAALKAEEGWNIDTKLDDGLPAQGKVMSLEVCADTDDVATAVYDITDQTVKCQLLFQPGW